MLHPTSPRSQLVDSVVVAATAANGMLNILGVAQSIVSFIAMLLGVIYTVIRIVQLLRNKGDKKKPEE